MNDRIRTGRLGEALACQSLQQRGYEIVERGWRCPQGEIDIVARDQGCWVFAEVKTRRGARAGLPEEALTARKAERLTELGQIYLSEHALFDADWRIDLVAIELGPQDQLLRMNVLPAIVRD